MTKLIDFLAMKRKDFWAMVDDKGDEAQAQFTEVWDKVGEVPITQEEAIEALNNLFIYTHDRIREHSSALAKNYPTKQYTKNKLKNLEDLWWVDHFTAGISRWSTLNWFSAKKGYFRGSKKLRYAGASTHFVQGYHDHPFYIIPLMHGAWHEPRRNKDSLSIEVVNAGLMKKGGPGNSEWHYWARKVPEALVQELPPVLLDKAYRGVKVMQPFTKDQIINNIKLKRLINVALHGKLIPERMSQHTDWRKHKTDMGPLWPYEECNASVFDNIPIEEQSFIQNYEDFLDEEGAIWDEASHDWDNDEEKDNPEYGDNTPTHDDDDDDDGDEVLDIEDVQRLLVKKGHTVDIDGKFGPQTRGAIRDFQAKWNAQYPSDKIAVDGLPGPQTCERLKK